LYPDFPHIAKILVQIKGVLLAGALYGALFYTCVEVIYMRKKIFVIATAVVALVATLGLTACGHGHVYTETVVEPTCTEKGYTLHECECGKSYIDNEINAKGHKMVDYVCTVCGELSANLPDSEGLGFALNADGESYSVIGLYNATGRVIKIPSEFDGKPVTAIGDGAFLNCRDIEYVLLPASINAIGEEAFRACGSLKSVTIPDGVTEIGLRTFFDCRNLEKVNIPESVTTIGGEAFRDCYSIKEIKIPDSVTAIGHEAFYSCSNLNSIIMPVGGVNIQWGAFYKCGYYDVDNNWYGDALYIGRHLISVRSTASGEFVIRHGTVSVAGHAFEENTEITNVIIPDSVRVLGDQAFQGCKGLTEIFIPNNVTYLGVNAFMNCTGLENITIPSATTSVSKAAFQLCSGLKRVIIQDGTTSLKEYCFSPCVELKSVIIPESVTEIDRYAFNDCKQLETIYYWGTKAQWEEIKKGYGWNMNTGNYTVHCADGDLAKA